MKLEVEEEEMDKTSKVRDNCCRHRHQLQGRQESRRRTRQVELVVGVERVLQHEKNHTVLEKACGVAYLSHYIQ